MSRIWEDEEDGYVYNSQEELNRAQTAKARHKKAINDIQKKAPQYVSFQKRRIARTRSQKYLIDNILPEGEIHLMGGQSGVGKSTLLLSMLRDYQQGLPILGFKTIPVPFVYIMCDSSSTSLQRKLDRLGMGDWDIPAYSIEELGVDPFKLEPDGVEIKYLPDIFPWAKLFVIEAINWFYAGNNKKGLSPYEAMLRFWSGVRDTFGTRNLTIWATTHVAKHKIGDGYESTRDKLHGTVGQPAICSTVMVLEKAKSGKKKILEIDARDYPKFSAEYTVQDNGALEFLGRVEEKEPEIDESDQKRDTPSFGKLDSRLASYSSGDLIMGSTIKEWYMTLSISLSTVNRWLSARVEDGTLTRTQHGIYKVTKATEQ